MRDRDALSASEDADSYRYDIKNSLNRKRGRELRQAEAYDWVEAFVTALLIIVLVFGFVARSATVIGQSMEPTLHEGDRLLVLMSLSEPDYGDIVVIDRSTRGEPPIIKRVIGKSGDTMFIDFGEREVWRNDQKLDEPYINEPTAEAGDVKFPVRVPEGAVFVMGDNRNHSLDSRTTEIGMVDTRKIMGKAALRFYPLDAAGVVLPDEQQKSEV